MKTLYCAGLLTLVMLVAGCSTSYPNRNTVNEIFPTVEGQTLSEKTVELPEFLDGKPTILLLGYRHKSQFDIDRWLIGLDMKEVTLPVLEVPALQGWLPELFRDSIDDSMREGIPSELWTIVVTVYGDGERIQEFTGNEAPKNARVLLLDGEGKVRYFYDRGFSVDALNGLIDASNRLN